MPDRPPSKWDLASLYPGNLNRRQTVADELDRLQSMLHSMEKSLCHWEEKDALHLAECVSRIDKVAHFLYCWGAESSQEPAVSELQGKLDSLRHALNQKLALLSRQAQSFSQAKRQRFQSSPILRRCLEDLTRFHQIRLPFSPPLDEFVSALAPDGFIAWQHFYRQERAKLQVTLDSGETIPMGKAERMIISEPDPNKRQKVYQAYVRTLEKESSRFASILNHLVGFRLKLYAFLNRSDVRQESLMKNRMGAKTLDAAMDAIDRHADQLSSFFAGLAAKMGQEKCSWQEWMSFSHSDHSSRVPYAQATELITEAFSILDPEMARFAERSFHDGTIDAVPSPNKPKGGFCAPFFRDGTSRIFLHYNGEVDDVRRLAHELGHAWHFYLLRDRSFHFPSDDWMDLVSCETAAIYAETAVLDRLMESSSAPEFKRNILGHKIKGFLYLMGIRAAYLFERRLHEARKKKLLTADEIERLAQEAQRECYHGALKEYHPYFWITQGQFYWAETPFYNYPYVCGYLLSSGLVDLAKREEKPFAEKMRGFLRETGSMDLEESIKKHFGIDVGQRDFWEASVIRLVKASEEYVSLL